MTQFEQIKNSLVNTIRSNRLIESDRPKWIVAGLAVSALIGFAITWFYINSTPNAPITAETSTRTGSYAGQIRSDAPITTDTSTRAGTYAEQIRPKAPATRGTAEEIANILSSGPSPNDKVSKINAPSSESDDGWSADSFLDVLKEPATESTAASTIENVTKQAMVVKKDPYISSLVDEAVSLSVLRPINAVKDSGDQASFSTYISVAETESTPLHLSPDGLLIVQNGDSLSQIALRLYGDSTMYKRIFEENRDTLNDPDIVRTGAQLRIPASQ